MRTFATGSSSSLSRILTEPLDQPLVVEFTFVFLVDGSHHLENMQEERWKLDRRPESQDPARLHLVDADPRAAYFARASSR